MKRHKSLNQKLRHRAIELYCHGSPYGHRVELDKRKFKRHKKHKKLENLSD